MSSFRRPTILVVLASVFLKVHVLATAAPGSAEERELENLAAFARLYGYVRYFHPSDQAAELDWQRFGIYGVERVRQAETTAELRGALEQLFLPVAPTIVIGDENLAWGEDASRPEGARITFWQHFGVQLGENPSAYKSVRAIPNAEGERRPIFPLEVGIPESLRRELGRGLQVGLPMALPIDAADRTLPLSTAELETLRAHLEEVDLEAVAAGDPAARLFEIIEVWNVFQHFHPYLSETGVDWGKALRRALERSFADADLQDHYATLSELVALTDDGHGYVFGRPEGYGGLPIRVEEIDTELIVSAVGPDSEFRKGDGIVSIDGRPAMEILKEIEIYVAGSPHLRRYRALNGFGEGPLDSVAAVRVERDGEAIAFEAPRRKEASGYFFNRLSEFDYPDIEEVQPGNFYVNLWSASLQDFEEKLPELARARGVIFDHRSDGDRLSESGEGRTRLLPLEHLLPHLTREAIPGSPMRVPQIIKPDREGRRYWERRNEVEPKEPYLAGKIAFINEPSVVSYGETYMAIVAHYGLGKMLGTATAGCNGGVNFVPLPSGMRVMFTGMEVRGVDGASFYAKGFLPDVPVVRSRLAVLEGRDEVLEAAITAIREDLLSE